MLVSYDLTLEEQQAVETMLSRRRISIAKEKAKNFLFDQFIGHIADFIAQNCNETAVLAKLILEDNTKEALINFILNFPEKFYNENDELSQLEFFKNLPFIF